MDGVSFNQKGFTTIMKDLFDITRIKNMEMKNRFIRGAVWECLADARGHLTPELIRIYQDLAQGGVGTIITGYAYITKSEQPNPGMMGIYDDSFISEYRQLTEIVHSFQTNIMMQIVYGGSQTNMDPPSKIIWGPSAIQNDASKITPLEMSKSNIRELVIAFGKAAARVKQAGFDGVVIHSAHGYLLSQFLCPHYNKRNDNYGGCIENRGRILFEVYAEVRKNVGGDYPVFVKINSEDFMDDGLTSQDSIFICKKLSEMGIDAIEVSGGNESSPDVLEKNLFSSRKIKMGKINESFFQEFAACLAKQVDTPVILVGGNRHYDIMDNLLNTTSISYFSLARPLIAEPDLVIKWMTDIKHDPKCISCNRCHTTPGKRCVF